jgi:hypothetical protein
VSPTLNAAWLFDRRVDPEAHLVHLRDCSEDGGIPRQLVLPIRGHHAALCALGNPHDRAAERKPLTHPTVFGQLVAEGVEQDVGPKRRWSTTESGSRAWSQRSEAVVSRWSGAAS